MGVRDFTSRQWAGIYEGETLSSFSKKGPLI